MGFLHFVNIMQCLVTYIYTASSLYRFYDLKNIRESVGLSGSHIRGQGSTPGMSKKF